MQHSGLLNCTANFNTSPFLLCGSLNQQTLIFLQSSWWKQINTHKHASTHASKPVGDSGTTLRQRSFKPVMWNDPFPSANQITSPGWAEVCKYTPTLKSLGLMSTQHTHRTLSLIRFCPTNFPVFVSERKPLGSARRGNTNSKILRGFSKFKVFVNS